MKDTFERLRAILRKYATRMVVKADKPTNYHIDAGYSEKWKKDVLFGAVRAGKNYVSYYLFPLYVYPDLLNGMPPELKKRMQGSRASTSGLLKRPRLGSFRR